MSERRFVMKLDIKNGQVDMTHGSGGRAMAQLIDELFIKHFDNDIIRQGNDQALYPVEKGRMVISTDGHVISPIFFPGGDIGSLAIHGTVNDVVMSGAKPLYLSVGFILEEGFPLCDLEKIVISMGKAAKKADIQIITGDTKVVEKGKADGIFITTTGIGVVADNIHISGDLAQVGDAIIVSGSIGDHGVAIMSQRENLQFDTQLLSDSGSLNDLVAQMIKISPDIHCLRDPTRGGLATALNEIARQSGVGMMINEQHIPVKPAVQAACELLGLDPLYVANEGKLVCICRQQDAKNLIKTMQQHVHGRDSAIIGEVINDEMCFVQMQTAFGGSRIVDWLMGDQLPRIC